MRTTRVVLAAAHLDHDPSNNELHNLCSLCQRCYIMHDRPHHLAQRRLTYLLRRALGDLFLGPYRGPDVTYAPQPGIRRTLPGARPLAASPVADQMRGKPFCRESKPWKGATHHAPCP